MMNSYMKDMINAKFFSSAFFMASVFFIIGLLSYGSVIDLIIKDGFFESAQGYWHSTLINGFAFALVGFLKVFYAWFDCLPTVKLRSFFSLFMKMILISFVVYSLSLLFVWCYYTSTPKHEYFINSNIMVSIDEVNIYWCAVWLLIFWLLSIIRLLVLKKNKL